MKKKVAIIGAGISGLIFANLLKKNTEYEFTIYEKKTSLDLSDGYGVQLSINSVSILNKIGFGVLPSRLMLTCTELVAVQKNTMPLTPQ